MKDQLEHYGLAVSEQPFRADGSEYKNIIGSYKAHNKKLLIVGAHYDVCEGQPGADDNASAVAGMLETARLVAAAQPQLDYRIDFIAYCLEEPPFFDTKLMGSYIPHSRSAMQEQMLSA